MSRKEKEAIIKEYRINEYESLRKENNKEISFTEYSINTNLEDDNQDNSKSSILAPFNTAYSNSSEFEIPFSGQIIENANNIIKLKDKIREIDRAYERNNNKEIDNGVYIDCEYSDYSLNLPEYLEDDDAKRNSYEEERQCFLKKLEVNDLSKMI